MGKKNKGQKIEQAPKEVVEEVDVEALNEEAEDLIGASDEGAEEEVSDQPGTLPDSEPDAGQTSDEDPEQAAEELGRDLRFLGYDVITKEKVYG